MRNPTCTCSYHKLGQFDSAVKVGTKRVIWREMLMSGTCQSYTRGLSSSRLGKALVVPHIQQGSTCQGPPSQLLHPRCGRSEEIEHKLKGMKNVALF